MYRCGNRGRFGLNPQFQRLVAAGLAITYLAVLSLGLYEMTAKSPALLGEPLPGWRQADRAERHTRWNPPTGFLPLDKILHEGEEAVRFYGFLIRPAYFRAPVSAAVS